MLWLLAMHLKYLHDLAATTSWVPAHREKLDRVVAFSPLFTVVPATVFATLVLSGRLQPIVGVAAVHGAASALAPAAAVIWGSSPSTGTWSSPASADSSATALAGRPRKSWSSPGRAPGRR